MKALRFLSIGRRLVLAFALLLVLLLAVALFARQQLRGQAATLRVIVGEQVQRVALAEDLQRQAQSAALSLLQLLLTPGRDERVPLYGRMDAANAAADDALKALEPLGGGAAALAELKQLRSAYADLFRDTVEQLEVDGSQAARAHFAAETQPALERLLRATAGLAASERAAMQSGQAMLESDLARAQMLLIACAGLAVALGIFLAWAVTRSITQPLAAAVAFADTIAEGRLDTRLQVDGADECGQLLQSLQKMSDALAGVVGKVHASTDNITTASGEIALGNADLSQRTGQTAGHLQTTASSMEQLTSTVKQTADAAQQASRLAASAAEVASRGGAAVSRVVRMMDEIHASSAQINDITGVIDGIAFQTNLLALNAAVEASRAGVQGRSFAVVAGEVRRLAGRSAEAAGKIRHLLEDSVSRIERGTQLAADAGQTMGEIVESAQRVSGIVGEIQTATSEQSAGIAQVNQAVGELDEMTQQNAALVEQSAAAADSLKEQAQRLSAAVSAFQLGDAGDAAARPLLSL